MARTSHSFRRIFGAFGALALAASALVVLGPIAVPAAHAGGACTDTWTNTGGGDWNTAADWSEGTVPTISDVACITNPGTYTVTLSTTETVGGLTLGGTTGSQTLEIASMAMLTGYGTTTNGSGASIDNAGTFIVPTNQTFDQGAGTTSGNPISLATSNLNFTGAGASSFSALSGYGPAVTGNLAADQSLALNSTDTAYFTGPLTNAGTITATGSGSEIDVTGGTFTNTGLLEAASGNTGALVLSGTFDNQGSGADGIAGDGSLTLEGALTNEGSISVAAGTTFTSEGALTNGTGTISNGGTMVSDYNDSFTEGSGPITGNPVYLTENDLTFTGTGASSFVGADSIFVSGNLAANQSLALTSAAAYFTGPATNAGTISGSGSGSEIAVTSGILTNTGVIEAESGSSGAFVLSGTFDNQGSGTDGIIGDSSVTLEGTLTNEGSIAVAAGTTFTNEGSLTNGTGTITNAGTLVTDYSNTFSEGSGPISGHPVYLYGSSLILTGNGQAGFVAADNYALFITGALAPLQTLTLQSGAGVYGLTTNNGTIDTQPGSNGATFEGPLANNGTLEVGSGSATTIAGSYTQGTGGTLQVDIGDPVEFGRLSVNGTASLAGQLVTQTSGFTPTIGSSFDVINTGGNALSGTFSTTAFGAQPYTTQYQVNQLDLIAASGMDVTTPSLPDGQLGTAYSATALTTSGGISPVTWTLNTNTLPPGLTLYPTTGIISGTPTMAGTFTFTVTADDSSTPVPQVASAQLTITIGGSGLTVTTTSLPAAQVGEPYPGAELLSTGGNAPVTWSVTKGKLPQGLNLDSGTGAVTGTPTKAGISTVSVTATDSSTPTPETSRANLTIAVSPALSVTTKSLPSGQVGVTYPGATLASSGGTAPVSWAVTSGSLPAGLSLNTATGTITGTPTGPGAIGSFTMTATDSSTPAALTASAGFSIDVASPPLNIASSITGASGGSLIGGQVGVPYPGATLTASGGTAPLTWAVTAGSLPAGLVLNDATGVISGTPTAAGSDNFTATLTDSSTPSPETAKVKLSITITPALSITTASLPAAQVGAAYTGVTLASTGGTAPVTWAVTSGKLPAGLSINGASGAITGTPSSLGSSKFTVTATDSSAPTPQTATTKLSINVNGPTLSVTTTTLPAGYFGSLYAGATLASTGGTAPIAWAVTSGSLPAGLSLNPATGAISGMPEGAGVVTTFTVTATDSSTPTAQTASAVLSIAVASTPLAISGISVLGGMVSALPGGTVGVPYPGGTLVSTGGTAPITWAVTKGNLPTGISLNPGTGAFTGTPSSPGAATFTVTATDSSGPTPLTAKIVLTIGVAGVLTVTTKSLPGAQIGVGYPGATLASTGGTAPVTWSVTTGTLPSGLSLDAATGAVTGTPTVSGSSAFTVTATDSGTPTALTASATLSITVAGNPLVFPALPEPEVSEGVAFTWALEVTGGQAPYTWSVPKSGGKLPPGLTVNPSTGVISGTPTGSGLFTFTATVTDSLHQTASETYNLYVNGVFPLLVLPLSPQFHSDHRATRVRRH